MFFQGKKLPSAIYIKEKDPKWFELMVKREVPALTGNQTTIMNP
jgi:hypothetical protein